jgi:DNA-binding NarL/FixJ family response regulator
MRVLIATAQPNLRLSLEIYLSEQPGVDIVGSASSSGSLVALIQTARPDIVITDWELPGPPLPLLLKSMVETQKPKIIILNNDEDQHLVREKGADAIVPKGTPPELLLKTLRQLCQESIKPGEEQP